MSVTVPIELPFTMTLTPISGSPVFASFTVPLIDSFCNGADGESAFGTVARIGGQSTRAKAVAASIWLACLMYLCISIIEMY